MPQRFTLVVTTIGLAMVVALLVFKPTGWREIGHAILVVVLVLVVVRIVAEVIALFEKPMIFGGGRLGLVVVALLAAGIAAVIVWWFPS